MSEDSSPRAGRLVCPGGAGRERPNRHAQPPARRRWQPDGGKQHGASTTPGNGGRLAALALAAALTAAASTAMAQGSGCWRSADCRDAPVAAAPSGDFRHGSGTAPGTDFRSSSGEPVGAGPLRLDGEPVAEAERRLQRPDNMRFRQYTAPTWPQPIGESTGGPDSTVKGYGQ